MSTLKRFGFENLHQDLKMGNNVARTKMDVLIKYEKREYIYSKKDHIKLFKKRSFLKNYHVIRTGNDF